MSNIYDKKLRNSIYNSLLSWFNYICFEDIKKKYNDCNEIEKLVYNVEKFYKKKKLLVVDELMQKKMTAKLEDIQKLFESEISLTDEKGDLIYEDDIIKCIDYSPQLLMLTALDYLINVDNDFDLRREFIHIDFQGLFSDIEKNESELFYSTMRIYNKLIKLI